MVSLRRRFLLWAALLTPLIRAPGALATVIGPSRSPADPGETLRAYLDTLLPEDAMPSATQVGVDRVMLAAAERAPGTRRMLHWGLWWLDREARHRGGDDFAGLGEDARTAIVARAEAAAAGSAPRVFFEATRTNALDIYYSRPESWPRLGFRGPPQPVGFPDHAEPPG
jgi:hypothetical protein